MYFDVGNDDPGIYRFIEGDEGPELVFNHFSKWLDSTVTDEIEASNSLKK